MIKKLTVEDVENNGMLIYSYIRGSKLYGTSLPPEKDENGNIIEVSDEDVGGVFIEPIETILGLGIDYCDEVKDEKGDKCYYSLKKYFSLLQESNPNILESLYIPDDKIIYKHPIMDQILNNKEKFLTKNCFPKFKGYAMNQIKKAKSLKKKINYDKPLERKSVLDFCFVPKDQGSQHIKNWLNDNGLKQEYCGLVKINNMDTIYGLYYDWGMHFENENISPDDLIYGYQTYKNISKSEHIVKLSKFIVKFYDLDNGKAGKNILFWYNKQKPIGYKGIILIRDDNMDKSNQVRLSSVSKGEKPLIHMSWQQQTYSSHCKDYWEYVEWNKNKNPQRFKQNVDAGMKMDLKNMTHCCRLLNMSYEIANNQGVNIDRTNIDKEWLMEIRTGKKDYNEIIQWANNKNEQIESLIENCLLPDSVDVDFVNDLLIQIRYKQLNKKI